MKAIFFGALLAFGARLTPGELLPEALRAFPAQTTSLEYDNLTNLRRAPNYASLRQQYAGEGLQRAQKALSALGIAEEQLSEVVTASGPNGFFGLLAGNFREETAERDAVKRGMMRSTLEDEAVFCSKDDICFLFPAAEEGHALFGTLSQLKAMAEVRQGRANGLRVNATFMNLFQRLEPRAPVTGIAPGREIGGWIGDSIPAALSSRIDVNGLFSSIETFGYSVRLDSKAHVSLNLICTSATAGTLLRDTLSAASGLQRAAAMAGGSTAIPFENLTASSSGRLVAVTLDAPIQ